MDKINWDEFNKVDLRVGKVISAEPILEVNTPSFKLEIDFGHEIGIKQSSTPMSSRYSPHNLIGKLVVGVVNFPAKTIGPIVSECLVTGFHNDDGHVVLCIPDGDPPLGSRLE